MLQFYNNIEIQWIFISLLSDRVSLLIIISFLGLIGQTSYVLGGNQEKSLNLYHISSWFLLLQVNFLENCKQTAPKCLSLSLSNQEWIPRNQSKGALFPNALNNWISTMIFTILNTLKVKENSLITATHVPGTRWVKIFSF